jgi:hypothetical protein
VFNISDLLVQATVSLKAALAVHKALKRWVLCFPFNLTGPTGRKGRSGTQKIVVWKAKQERAARKAGHCLTIEIWPKSKLLGELLRLDTNGGMRTFFFESTVLTREWFQQHLASAAKDAEPRYNRELSVETNLWKWFSALGRTSDWLKAFESLLQAIRTKTDDLRSAVARTQDTRLDPTWPENSKGDGEACIAQVERILSAGSQLLAGSTLSETTREQAIRFRANLAQCLKAISELEVTLKNNLETQHGWGTADSVGFRQFMAEYEVSFPMASLDSVREVKKTLDQLSIWLNTPAGWAAFESTLLLTGMWGSGKTHGICDAAIRRLKEGRLSVVAFGHRFDSGNPWTRLREELALPTNLPRDRLLDVLNSAAEASGNIMILWLDAINETKPLRYWRERLAAFADAVARRPFLRLCVSCRTSYAEYCVPKLADWYCAEHQGFSGNEYEATRAFFEHYQCDPPLSPIYPPEFSNPLYLRLVCETLAANGLKKLPPGWVGLATAIRAFLEHKNRDFALAHEISEGAQVIPQGLRAIAREIATQGVTALSWSAADRAFRNAASIPSTVSPIEWLVRENLLIEDVPKLAGTLEPEHTVRPAFERLGDFLVAQELLSGVARSGLRNACRAGGGLGPYLESAESVTKNEGLVSALSILVPEQTAKGFELAEFFDDGPIRSAIVKIAVRSYPWRDPSTFSNASHLILGQALGMKDFGFLAMDAALAIACQASAIDALWLHRLLNSRPMAHRDAFWCGYLHKSYESSGPVKRLAHASLELPLDHLDPEMAERWATILLWFAGAADRRVKDKASRGAIALLGRHPAIVPSVVRRMAGVDDDAIRERTLLAAYGACILTRDRSALSATCKAIGEALARNPEKFHNALIRDHTRCLAELAQMLDIRDDADELPALLEKLRSPWPLDLPSEEQIKSWDDLPKLADSCLHDDFFVYSLGCLDEWGETISKTDMGKWILRRIVEDFAYAGSGCEGYDAYMLSVHGPGRSKPTWAERIGKKYQWIAMYQLAARLADHAVRKPERSFKPEALRAPLVLLEERQLDPTLQGRIADRENAGFTWWIPATVDLAASANLTDSAWAKKHDDIPSLGDLLRPVQNQGIEWLLLNGYLGWDSRPDGSHSSRPYRDLWIHVRGYLLDSETSEKGFTSIAGRNFFQRWMPEGASWLHGFAGEYPWGTAFNVEPEWYHSRGSNSALPCNFTPICSEVVAEWEYDSSLPRYPRINVPARVLFEPGDLWWNGKDGFLDKTGRTLFRSPNVSEGGPSALIADRDEFRERLARLKKRIVWTMLGEKRILAVRHDKPSPSCTFSQVAIMELDGSLRSSKLTFFVDRREAIGPVGRSLPVLPQVPSSQEASGRRRKQTARQSRNEPRWRKAKGSNHRKAKKPKG